MFPEFLAPGAQSRPNRNIEGEVLGMDAHRAMEQQNRKQYCGLHERILRLR